MAADEGRRNTEVGKLTDDDLDVIAGRQEQLQGKIQERYGITGEEAAKQIGDWTSSLEDVDSTRHQKAS